MSSWKEIGVFASGEANEIKFEFRMTNVSKHPASLKRKNGVRLIVNEIIDSSLTDYDVQLEVYLFGVNKTYINGGLTITQEEDRLLALRDQTLHPFDIGKYSGDYIMSECDEDIEYNNNHIGVKKYNCTFLHKQL